MLWRERTAPLLSQMQGKTRSTHTQVLHVRQHVVVLQWPNDPHTPGKPRPAGYHTVAWSNCFRQRMRPPTRPNPTYTTLSAKHLLPTARVTCTHTRALLSQEQYEQQPTTVKNGSARPVTVALAAAPVSRTSATRDQEHTRNMQVSVMPAHSMMSSACMAATC